MLIFECLKSLKAQNPIGGGSISVFQMRNISFKLLCRPTAEYLLSVFTVRFGYKNDNYKTSNCLFKN